MVCLYMFIVTFDKNNTPGDKAMLKRTQSDKVTKRLNCWTAFELGTSPLKRGITILQTLE